MTTAVATEKTKKAPIRSAVGFIIAPIKDIITSIPENYEECEYRTKDGVSLGSYLKTNKKNKEWRIYIQTKSYTNRSQEFLDIDKIDEIISLLNKSLENLNENL